MVIWRLYTTITIGKSNAYLKPFVDEDHPLQNYFPAWEYAIRVPLIILIVGLTIIFTFLGFTMAKSKNAQTKKSK